MSYSTTIHAAVGILAFIHIKMKEYHYEFISAKVISEHLYIPAPSVVKVLKSLNVAGIITTKEGAKGGVLLAKPLSQITLLDVFLAVEPGRPLFKRLPENYKDKMHGKADIIFKNLTNTFDGAERAMKESLASTTLEDLLKSKS